MGRLNSMLRSFIDAKGRQLKFFMTAGHVGHHPRGAALLGSLPAAD
jgi:hypothetical protein